MGQAVECAGLGSRDYQLEIEISFADGPDGLEAAGGAAGASGEASGEASAWGTLSDARRALRRAPAALRRWREALALALAASSRASPHHSPRAPVADRAGEAWLRGLAQRLAAEDRRLEAALRKAAALEPLEPL